MDDSRLNELFTELRKKYPKMDYFTQEEIFQYMRMAFHLGYDIKNNTSEKPVIRSDGVKYISISDAARKNHVNESSIRKSIKKGGKSVGYYWSIS